MIKTVSGLHSTVPECSISLQAETSVTIDDIEVVIDCGRAKVPLMFEFRCLVSGLLVDLGTHVSTLTLVLCTD